MLYFNSNGFILRDFPPCSVCNAFDRLPASFELRDLRDLRDVFDVWIFTQGSFVVIECVHRDHIAQLRGHMNVNVLSPLGG